jgi:hypothetical protein
MTWHPINTSYPDSNAIVVVSLSLKRLHSLPWRSISALAIVYAPEGPVGIQQIVN